MANSRALFYLEPEALDRPHDNLWQKAGDQIRDALSLGRLRIWGRPTKTKLGDWIGERAALRPIENTYWERAFFTYTFFDASARSDTDCYADRNTGRPAYGDLQVNRAEVLKVWPGDPDDQAENYPNVCVADSPSIIDLFGGSERTKLVALLASGSLRSWARPSADHTRGDPDFVKLEGTIWNTHKFRFDPKRGAWRNQSDFFDTEKFTKFLILRRLFELRAVKECMARSLNSPNKMR